MTDSTETEQLVVQLEARIAAFEKNFTKASQTANSNWNKIEARGRLASTRIQADMARATTVIARNSTGLGGILSGALGFGGAAGAAALFLGTAIKINGELANMAKLAKQAQISTDKFQEIKFAANSEGVSDDDFNTSLQTSLQTLEEAQHQVNDLRRLFNANGKSIYDSNQQLIKFDALLSTAADLISRAPTEQAKVKITEMLGLSREWVRVLQGGPEAFRKMQQEAQSAGAVIDSATIAKAKEFDEAWTRSITKFKAGIVDTLTDLAVEFAEFWQKIIDSVPGASYIVEKFRRMFGGLEEMTIPELQDALQRSIEQGVDKVEIDRIQAELDRRLGKKPLRITITPEVKGPQTVIPQEKQKNTFDSAVFAANKRIAAIDAETKTIGQNSEARDRATLVAELEEAAKRANTQAGFQNAAVTESQREKINQLADAMDAAAKRQRETQEQFKAFNDVLQLGGSFVDEYFNKLISGSVNVRQMLADMTKQLAKMAIEAAVLGTGPLAGMLGTKSTVPGGTGGIMGAIGSFFGGARAEGGDVSPGKAFLVGERGREIFVPKGPGTIIPNSKIGRGQTNVTTNNHVINATVNANGGNHSQNQDLAEQVGRALDDRVKSMIAGELNTQMRQGGVLAR